VVILSLLEKINMESIDIEVELFISALFMKYGYDFRNYSKAHMKRRILHRLSLTPDVSNISELIYKILYDEVFFKTIISDFSINVTEMFRDPDFYQALREKVVPYLRTYPFIKIWHAGCSTGEEVYSMAILLMEEGLYDRAQIYATDFNDTVLEEAKEGIYPIERIKEYTQNYQKSGGKDSFSTYYTAKYNLVKFNENLKKRIVFSNHNLVTDGTFGEMNLIICRNVLIYFDRNLQNRVFNLFKQSLVYGGILGIGSKESLSFSDVKNDFINLVEKEKIYKKKSY
jgi:Methylase of chemotaxis methyl-accepting proteins